MNYNRKKGKPTTTYLELEDCIKGITKKGDAFYIDKEDYEKIKEWSWQKDNHGYITTTINKKRIQQHRMLMGLTKGDGMQVDHINRNKIDNRRSNLKICNFKENQRNKNAMSTSKTNIRGVCYEKERNKWRVQINTNEGRKRFRCNTIDEAIKLRNELERRHWNECEINE